MTGRPRTDGGVWGSYVEYLKGLEAENRELAKCDEEHVLTIERLREAAQLVREAHRPYREDMVRVALEAIDVALGTRQG